MPFLRRLNDELLVPAWCRTCVSERVAAVACSHAAVRCMRARLRRRRLLWLASRASHDCNVREYMSKSSRALLRGVEGKRPSTCGGKQRVVSLLKGTRW
jgi:hypothetical protein